MPTINLPLVKGSGTSKSSKYIDKLPVNLVVVPRDTGNDNYYLRSFPGMTKLSDSDGISLSAEYNDVAKKEYRLIGSELYEDGVSVKGDLSPSLSNMCHSATSQAFVSGGKLNYWKDGDLHELKNWKEGENYISYPDFKYVINFDGYHALTIPDFIPDGDFTFSASVWSLLQNDFNLLYGEKASGSSTYKYQLYFDKADGKLYEIISKGSSELRKDEVGDLSKEGDDVFVTLNSTSGDVVIPITKVGGADGKYLVGTIDEFTLYALTGGAKTQQYSTIMGVSTEDGSKPPAPTDPKIPNELDSTMKAKLDRGMVWTEYREQSDPIKSPETTYKLNGIIDIDRHQSRFVYLTKDYFGCTAISIGVNGDENTDPEMRPDYIAAEYVQRSDPDDNKAIRSYQGKYIAVFGRNTTEFFSLTGNPDQIYQAVGNLQCPAGIVSTGAICHFMGSFAGIGSSKGGSIRVIMIKPGSYESISNATIDRILSKYTIYDFESSLVESFVYENHQFLVVHLRDETLIYDGITGVWVELCSGYGRDRVKYQGRHFVFNQKEGFTVASLNSISKLDDSVSSQNGEIQEFIAYTPFLEVSKGYGMTPLFDLTFDSIYGHTNAIETAFVSVTLDGRVFSEEELRIEYNEPGKYLNKVFVQNIGPVQKSIGFKLKSQSKSPVALSDFSIRAGY